MAACENILLERKAHNLRTAVFDFLIAHIENAAAQKDFTKICKFAGLAESHFSNSEEFEEYFEKTGRFPRPNKKMKKLGEVLRPIAFEAHEKTDPVESSYITTKALKHFAGTDFDKERLIKLAQDNVITASCAELSYPGEFEIVLSLVETLADRLQEKEPQGAGIWDDDMSQSTLDIAFKARRMGYYDTARELLELTEKFTPCACDDNWDEFAREAVGLEDAIYVSSNDSNHTLLDALRRNTESLRDKTQELSTSSL